MEGALVGNTEGSALKTSVQIFLTKIRKTVAIMLEVAPFIIGDVFFFKMYFLFSVFVQWTDLVFKIEKKIKSVHCKNMKCTF